MSLFSELKRRNVIRVGAAYIVIAWLIIQVAETLFPLFGFGDGPARIVVVVLVLALAYFAFDKFVLDPHRDLDISESATKAGANQAREEARPSMFSEKSVAVLPFTNRSERKEDEYFCRRNAR